jgi:hypothetical protein
VTNPREATQYLTLTGVLYPDNQLILDPGFLTTEPNNAIEDRESALVAEMIGESGRLLLRFGLPYGLPCTDGAPMTERLVIGKVPFPPSTRTIRFSLDGIVIHELEVAREAPRVTLTWDPAEGTAGERQVRWHGEGGGLSYLLSYSNDNGQTWKALSLPTTDTEHAVDFDRLAGGKQCRLRVMVSDGVNTTEAISEPFERPTQPCFPIIVEPEDGTTFSVGESIRLRGHGYYLEEQEPELELLEWASSTDGPVGHGAAVEVPWLSAGRHVITLTAGREGRASTATVTIYVADDPAHRTQIGQAD